MLQLLVRNGYKTQQSSLLCVSAPPFLALNVQNTQYAPIRQCETKDFARLTSHPVRGWTGKNKAFCSPGTQNGGRVIKVYGCLLCTEELTR